MLTINGKAELIVQDAVSCQRPVDLVDRRETIQAVREGVATIEEVAGRPMDEVLDALEKEFGASDSHRSGVARPPID